VSSPRWTAAAGNRGAHSGDLTREQTGRRWGWTRGTVRLIIVAHARPKWAAQTVSAHGAVEELHYGN
jgi:hypothetical protein